MRASESEGWANPSSVHSLGRAARRRVEDVREQLARVLQVSARDVLFTSGATEANHLALAGAKVLVTSRIEHPSIVEQAEWLASRGTRVVFADITASGLVTADAVAAALDEALGVESAGSLETPGDSRTNENTPLVALMAANHETGVLQPLAEVAEVARRRGARLHVDAVQLLGRAPLGCLEVADSVSLSAHKFRGPKGVGALAFACGWTPLPQNRGGAQERGLRPGTLDVSAIVGLGAALGRLDESLSAYRRVAQLAQALERSLLTHSPHAVSIHGATVARLGHVVNFRVPGWRGDELVVALDLEGICVSSGSACSAGTAEPSTVIRAMEGQAAAEGAVRVSFGEESTSADLHAVLGALARLGILGPVEHFPGQLAPSIRELSQ